MILLGMNLVAALLQSGFSGRKKNHPIINGIMATNQIVLQDNEGDYPDWIEIFNPTEFDISLSDYWLYDHPQMKIPGYFRTSIRPGEYLICYWVM